MSEKRIGPVHYEDNAVLTQEQVAEWLGLSVRTVRDLPIPRLNLPKPRYVAGEVLAALAGRGPFGGKAL